jgi:hypothetical protein
MEEYTFPSHYPPNCPPSGCGENPGVYYRLVNCLDSVSRLDFLSDYDVGRRVKLEAISPCVRRCVSIFSAVDSIASVRSQFPNLPRFIAELRLNGHHGLIGSNRSQHHNWWIPEGVEPSSFVVRIFEE